MEVRGTRKETIRVEVDPVDMLQQLRQNWLSGKPGHWINKGKWMKEYHTSHSWNEDVGHASDLHIEIWNAFNTLEEVARQIK